jgi:lipid A 4'-phosphatase
VRKPACPAGVCPASLAETNAVGWRLQVFCKVAGASAWAMSTHRHTSLSPRPTVDRLIVVLLVAVIAVSLFFWFLPGVDLAVSRLFFTPGEGFTLVRHSALRALRKSSDLALGAIVILILVRILCDMRTSSGKRPHWKTSLWLLGGLAVGPGLVVNAILKTFWGRPRPHDVDVFGGEEAYQMVWVISDSCERNCSFVSGEASSSAWLVAAAVVTPKAIRPAATVAAVVYAASLSLNRVAFGAHFLSDVVLALLICGLLFALLYRLVFEGTPAFLAYWGRMATRTPDR